MTIPQRPFSCIIIDPDERPSVKLQIQRHIEYMIAIGAYRAGERLPTTAELGVQLGRDEHTVRAAYAALRELGTIVTGTSTGSTVAQRAVTPRLLRSVARSALSPAVGTARSIGCSRSDVAKVVAELLDQWFVPEDTK